MTTGILSEPNPVPTYTGEENRFPATFMGQREILWRRDIGFFFKNIYVGTSDSRM